MYLLFDIGATKTRIAVSKDRVTFEDPVIFNTVADYSAGIKKFIKRSADTYTAKY